MTEKTTHPCSEKLSHIYEYLDGALSCEELEEMNEHLEHCEHCANEHNLECVIRSVVKRSCTEPAPEELKSKIWDRISNLRESQHAVSE
ncbi:mycothiol system anti-sigma-R factor [uncultured Rothia sp.]|uniref:mycothiol system anti-sigma-R factor n=1 Tax=uncultured Rothia sp. TaxID=316088 RepID=UPI0032169800